MTESNDSDDSDDSKGSDDSQGSVSDALVSEKRSDKKNWSNFSPNVRVVRRTIFHTNATP